MGKRKVGNGEGSLYFSETTQKWNYQYYYLGKRYTLTQKKNERVGDFKRRVTEIKQSINDNTYIEKKKITIYELGKEILDSDYKRNKISPATYCRNIQTLSHIKDSKLANISIQDCTSEQIQKFIDDKMDYSNSYIEKIFALTSRIFLEAMKRDYIIKNPMIKVEKPKSNKLNKKVEAFSIDEQKAFVEAVQKDIYKNVFIISLYTGMRIGEVLALTLDSIDFKSNVIHITKTLTIDENDKIILGDTTKTYNSTRNIPITNLIKKELIEAIQSMKLNKDNLIFTTPYGTPIRVSNLNIHFKKICKDANIGFKTTQIIRNDRKTERVINHKTSNCNQHMLRHTYATRMIESGVPAEVLQKLLGHKDIQTTINTYTTIFDKFKNEQVDKFITYINSI